MNSFRFRFGVISAVLCLGICTALLLYWFFSSSDRPRPPENSSDLRERHNQTSGQSAGPDQRLWTCGHSQSAESHSGGHLQQAVPQGPAQRSAALQTAYFINISSLRLLIIVSLQYVRERLAGKNPQLLWHLANSLNKAGYIFQDWMAVQQA